MIAFWRKSKQIIAGILFLPVVVLAAYHLAYSGKTYPHVRVAGIDMSNKSLVQAEGQLEMITRREFIEKPAVKLVYEGHEWNILKAEMGFVYKPKETAEVAYKLGRSGQLVRDLVTKWQMWFGSIEIPLQFDLNEQLLDERIASIAAELVVPPVPPTIEIANDVVKVIEGESGQLLKIAVIKKEIIENLGALNNGPVNLPIETVVVEVTADEVEKTRQRAEIIAKRALEMEAAEQKFDLSGQELVDLLEFKGGWQVNKLHDYVVNLAKSIDRPPQNAAFQYVEGRVSEFKAAKDGLKLQQDVAVKEMVEGLARLETGSDEVVKVTLSVTRAEPEITLSEVNNLGIKELLGKGISTYRGSIPGRVHNVGLSASRINGILVAPGETFSFNNTVGEISAATGYQQAYVIRSGATVLDDGGGVCQTSTTLFRAVLNAGLPVLERKAHSYRVGYYEQNAKAGLDATVFAPTADLKFVNDTPGHILIQTSANSATKTLVVEIYGTSDGRAAEITNHRIWDVVPAPPPRYQDDPSLPSGQVKQVDWAAAGAKAKFDYTVKRNGEVIYSKTFLSVFRPWQAVYLRGTAAN